MVVIASAICYAIGLGTLSRNFVYTADQTSTITYYITKEKEEAISYTLEYQGVLAPYQSFTIDDSPISHYSTAGNTLDKYIEREFNLTNLTSATLEFYTKYEIEYGWDFGYVELSTNNGTNWTQLNCTTTTFYRDGSASFGVVGAPSFTGEVENWSYETSNLTPYVDGEVKLRFRYVTDNFVAEKGWLVDDIRITELEFYDDATGNYNWTTNGWLTTDKIGHEGGNKTAIRVDVKFNIPDSFSYSGTQERIILTQIHWAEEAFIPSFTSLPQIIVELPGISKYVAPPTPGGNGGGRPSSYFRYSGNLAIYRSSQMGPSRITRIRPGRQIDSPIIELSILTQSLVRDSRVEIEALDGNPADILDELTDVYRYFGITSSIPDSQFKDVKIQFFITSQWLEENDAKKEDIVLMRYHQGEWQELETIFVSMEGPNYIFESTTPGFSTFAIKKKSSPIEKPVIEPEPTEIPETPNFDEMLFVGNDTEIEKMKQEILMKTQDAEAQEVVEEKDEPVKIVETSVETEDKEPDDEPTTVVQKTMKAIRGEEEDTLAYVEQEIFEMKPGTAGKMLYKGMLTLSMIGTLMTIIALIIGVIVIHEIRKIRK